MGFFFLSLMRNFRGKCTVTGIAFRIEMSGSSFCDGCLCFMKCLGFMIRGSCLCSQVRYAR